MDKLTSSPAASFLFELTSTHHPLPRDGSSNLSSSASPLHLPSYSGQILQLFLVDASKRSLNPTRSLALLSTNQRSWDVHKVGGSKITSEEPERSLLDIRVVKIVKIRRLIASFLRSSSTSRAPSLCLLLNLQTLPLQKRSGYLSYVIDPPNALG